jgi:hypothetical protein
MACLFARQQGRGERIPIYGSLRLSPHPQALAAVDDRTAVIYRSINNRSVSATRERSSFSAIAATAALLVHDCLSRLRRRALSALHASPEGAVVSLSFQVARARRPAHRRTGGGACAGGGIRQPCHQRARRQRDRAAAALAELAVKLRSGWTACSIFLVLETIDAGVRPEALVECYQRQAS